LRITLTLRLSRRQAAAGVVDCASELPQAAVPEIVGMRGSACTIRALAEGM
jgi:hypothetical protein